MASTATFSKGFFLGSGGVVISQRQFYILERGSSNIRFQHTRYGIRKGTIYATIQHVDVMAQPVLGGLKYLCLYNSLSSVNVVK